MYLDQTPEFKKIVDLVVKRNPLQKKRIEAFYSQQDQEYWDFCEKLSRKLNSKFLLTEENLLEAVDAYNKMCMDFLREQIKFKKTGQYSVQDASVAEATVYSDLSVMRYYMLGLLISYMLWPNHYALFRFFLDHLPKHDVKNYLEVGVGHGLFSSTMLSTFPDVKGTGVDISETSINIAKSILGAFDVSTDRLDFIRSDYLTVDLGQKQFDFIIMGEVLEHVNNAPEFMTRTKELLAPGGQVYMTTCANCPALDHVYHFHCVCEIRDLVKQAGFKIVADSALPADDVPEEKWREELTTINYCCILEHA